jgi:hypothetical protein
MQFLEANSHFLIPYFYFLIYYFFWPQRRQGAKKLEGFYTPNKQHQTSEATKPQTINKP